MKKNTLFVMMVCSFLSCKENHNGSERKSTYPDSSELPDKMKTTLNIDALNASPANFKLLLNNQYVRVLEYTLEPSKKDEWHTHPAKSSYVVSGGQLKVYLENGEIIMSDEKTGTTSWSDAVGRHCVENVGQTTVKIILTEIKSLDQSY